MKFSFNNKRLFFNILLGVLWIIIGYFKIQESQDWLNYAFLLIGIIYLSMGIHDYFMKYLVIDSEKIQTHNIPYKSIYLKEIEEATFSGENYYLKSKNKTIQIPKNLFRKDELSTFNDFFNDISQNFIKTDKNHVL